MRSHRRSAWRRHPPGGPPVPVLALLLVVAVSLTSGCAGTSDDGSAGASGGDRRGDSRGDSGSAAADPGFGHVHGLGLDPADGAVYAATHFGVWRLPLAGSTGSGPDRPGRVAGRFQDTMGFTVSGPGTFFGSGHPDPREDLPPHLGLIVSTDEAQTWQSVSLQGEADLHDIAVVGDRIYGYDATRGALRVSDDAGRTWQERPPAQIADMTVDPADPDRLLGTTPSGLQLSSDAGLTFQPLSAAPPLLAVDWAGDVLAGADADGAVWVASGEPDAGWERRGSLRGPPQAFTALADGRLLAADDQGVQLSRDGGRTWGLLAGYDVGGAHEGGE